MATLGSLADALADIEADGVGDEDEGLAEQARQGKVRHTSLKSRPGALKRKERVMKSEMERFSKSLAQLETLRERDSGKVAGGDGQLDGMEVEAKEGGTDAAPPEEKKTESQIQRPGAPTASRFAALRGFIVATMEQNPAFISRG